MTKFCRRRFSIVDPFGIAAFRSLAAFRSMTYFCIRGYSVIDFNGSSVIDFMAMAAFRSVTILTMACSRSLIFFRMHAKHYAASLRDLKTDQVKIRSLDMRA